MATLLIDLIRYLSGLTITQGRLARVNESACPPLATAVSSRGAFRPGRVQSAALSVLREGQREN